MSKKRKEAGERGALTRDASMGKVTSSSPTMHTQMPQSRLGTTSQTTHRSRAIRSANPYRNQSKGRREQPNRKLVSSSQGMMKQLSVKQLDFRGDTDHTLLEEKKKNLMQ